jgi:glucose/mannose-6-phosphate isomerase
MIVEHLKVIKNDSLVHEKLKQIAMSIEDNIVSIFNSFDITGVALRLSAQMNENSKLYTHISNFPECNHNEILAMEHMKKLPLKAIFIESKYDYDRIKIRMDIIRNMLKNNGIEIFCLKTDSVNYLDEVVSLIYMGDMLSVYTAINRGVVAGDIDEIEDLKKELKKR